MAVVVTRLVTDLNVQCSLRVRNFASQGFAMSDCCGRPATNAVEDASRNFLYRCSDHKGIVSLVLGPVWATIQVREED